MKTRRAAVLLLLLAALSSCRGAALNPKATEGSPSGGRAGTQAPEFELKDVNGATVHFSDIKGKVRLVDFWTTWCAPCRQEIPVFKELHAAYADKGFTLVGIAMDDEGVSKVKPFVDENQIPYLTLIGTESVASSFGGVVGFPTKYLIDGEGKIVATWVGPVPRAVLEEKIQQLL